MTTGFTRFRILVRREVKETTTTMNSTWITNEVTSVEFVPSVPQAHNKSRLTRDCHVSSITRDHSCFPLFLKARNHESPSHVSWMKVPFTLGNKDSCTDASSKKDPLVSSMSLHADSSRPRHQNDPVTQSPGLLLL